MRLVWLAALAAMTLLSGCEVFLDGFGFEPGDGIVMLAPEGDLPVVVA